MESDSQKIIAKIEAILPLLKLSDSRSCAYYHDFLMNIRAQLNMPHDPVKIASKILSIYGGMATFSDMGIWKDGEALSEEDDRFSELRNELFLICNDLVGGPKFGRE